MVCLWGRLTGKYGRGVVGVRTREYTLKIYDEPLLTFRVTADDFGVLTVDVVRVVRARQYLLPCELIDSPDSEHIRLWLESRTIPKNRQFVHQILAAAGLTIQDRIGILDVCKGLSVNDCYWLDDGRENLKFSEINLYDHRLDETLALIAYTGYSSSARHKIGLSSEWTTNGQYPKAWRRMDGQLVLFKGGSERYANAGMEPYSEYFAAQIAGVMGIPHVTYDLQQWKGKLASTCPLMNDRITAFVPFWAATQVSEFPQNLAVAYRAGSGIFEALRTMLMFDALICNTDRHAGNYGFLRDNRSGKITSLAPLFDHNLSLFPHVMDDDFNRLGELAHTEMFPANSGLSFVEQAHRIIGPKQHEQLRHLIGFTLKNHPQYPVSADRLAALNTFLAERTRELLDIPRVQEQDLADTLRALFNTLPPLPSSLFVETVKPANLRSIGSKSDIGTEIARRIAQRHSDEVDHTVIHSRGLKR